MQFLSIPNAQSIKLISKCHTEWVVKSWLKTFILDTFLFLLLLFDIYNNAEEDLGDCAKADSRESSNL